MTRTRARCVQAALVVATLWSASCSTSINRILADPSHYRDREVSVSGRVEDSFSILDRGAYRITDGSGSLWVVSDRGVPRDGARVSVKGMIREGFNLGPLAGRIGRGVGNGIVLVETSHHAKY